jgi:hypothetical protein
MDWIARLSESGTDRLPRTLTPGLAIDAACRLLDNGCPVLGIGTGELNDSNEADEIAGICHLWVRAKPGAAKDGLVTKGLFRRASFPN